MNDPHPSPLDRRPDLTTRWTRTGAPIQALVGAAVWLLLAPRLYREEREMFGPIRLLLLLAVLVIVPLALALLARPGPEGRHPLVYRAAVLLQPFAAASVTASFLFAPGRLAAILASPWALFAVLAAAFGILRIYRRKGERLSRLDELCADAGLVYLPVAARWLLLSRAGIQPPRVPEPIVSLTAIHFHYTFFAATVLTGLLGQSLAGADRARRIFAPAAIGVLLGPLLVATGINAAIPPIEALGAVLLATSLLVIALLTIFAGAPRAGGLPARALLTPASIALCAGMALASAFALGKYLWVPTIDLPEMIRLHGAANAVFAVGSLLGWHAARGRA